MLLPFLFAGAHSLCDWFCTSRLILEERLRHDCERRGLWCSESWRSWREDRRRIALSYHNFHRSLVVTTRWQKYEWLKDVVMTGGIAGDKRTMHMHEVKPHFVCQPQPVAMVWMVGRKQPWIIGCQHSSDRMCGKSRSWSSPRTNGANVELIHMNPPLRWLPAPSRNSDFSLKEKASQSVRLTSEVLV